jgi:hypothetical protein
MNFGDRAANGQSNSRAAAVGVHGAAAIEEVEDAALIAGGETEIHGADAAAVSFPEFFDLLDSFAER